MVPQESPLALAPESGSVAAFVSGRKSGPRCRTSLEVSCYARYGTLGPSVWRWQRFFAAHAAIGNALRDACDRLKTIERRVGLGKPQEFNWERLVGRRKASFLDPIRQRA